MKKKKRDEKQHQCDEGKNNSMLPFLAEVLARVLSRRDTILKGRNGMVKHMSIGSHVQTLDTLSESAEVCQQHDIAVLGDETLFKITRVCSRKQVTKTPDFAHDCMIELCFTALNLLKIFTKTLDAWEKHLHRTLHPNDVHRHWKR